MRKPKWYAKPLYGVMALALVLGLTLVLAMPVSAVPILTSPGDGDYVTTDTPTFVWAPDESTEEDAYVEIYLDAGPTNLYFRSSAIVYAEQGLYTLPDANALVDGVYYWRIHEVTDGDSLLWSFTVDTQVPQVPESDITLSVTSAIIGDTVDVYVQGPADTASVAFEDISATAVGSVIAFADDGGEVDEISGDYKFSARITVEAGTLDNSAYGFVVDITDNAGNIQEDLTATTNTLDIDNQKPAVNDANISIAGGTGTGEAYIVGDTVEATWDNTVADGDGNLDIATVTVDFTAFGGEAAVEASNADEIWTATYTILAGSIDASGLNVSVTATDDAGNLPTTTADTTGATLDNQAPTIDTPGTVELTTDVGADGIASIGDTITYAGGTPGVADGDTWTVDLSAYGLSATAAPGAYEIVADDDDGAFAADETVTDDAGNTATGAATITGLFAIDNQAPTVTDANISIAGGTGTGEAYIVGDTVTATWDNTVATGDGNLDINTVTVDFSAFGGGDAVAASNAADTWTATYTILAGSIDTSGLNVSVTATDDAGNPITAADTTGATLDNQAPTIDTPGTVELTTDVGADGIASIGDTITYAGGTPGAADGDTWTVDLSAYGLSATAATGTHDIIAGDDDGAFTAEETVTDNGGNTATGAATITGLFAIDNEAPTVTDANISIAGGTGTDEAYIVGDTVTATWDNTVAIGDGNLDINTVTVDFSAFGGGDAVAASNAADTWTATYTILAGAIDDTNLNVSVTATDDAGNPITTADTTNATLDNQAPTASFTPTGDIYQQDFTVIVTFDEVVTITAATWDITDVKANLTTADNKEYNLVRSGVAAGTHTLSLTAEDSVGNSDTYTNEFIVKTKLDIALYQGSNLVSLPLVPEGGSVLITTILPPAATEAWCYEAAEGMTGTWYVYRAGDLEHSDLTVMVDGKAYWVEASAPATMTATGSEQPTGAGATPCVYQVYQGWNMLGFKSMSTVTPPSGYFAPSIALTWLSYSPATGYASDPDPLNPGEGYWVYFEASGQVVPSSGQVVP